MVFTLGCIVTDIDQVLQKKKNSIYSTNLVIISMLLVQQPIKFPYLNK